MHFIRFKRLIRKWLLKMRRKLIQYFIMIVTMNFGTHSDATQSKNLRPKDKRSNKNLTEAKGYSFVQKYAEIYSTDWRRFLQYLTSTPKYTTVRVDLSNYKPGDLVEVFKNQLVQRYGESPEVYVHPQLPDCIVVGPLKSLSQSLIEHPFQIIVDMSCGLAVLRGADVFAPGVLAMPVGIPKGAQVSVYADLSRKCLRGQTAPYAGNKFFLACGVLKMHRAELFASADPQPRGVAIEITSVRSQVPHLHVDPSMGLLQNLPSILAGHYLDVQGGHKVLDMCSAPGNKLTHVARLMNNTGTLIALDKSKSRISRLKEKLIALQLGSIQTHVLDSTSISTLTQSETDRMNLHEASFDRILLDAPCSGFGQRPMFEIDLNTMNSKIKSHTHVQKKLLEAAIRLLKEKGILVYCTCSLSVEENESMIAWLLAKHPEMELMPTLPKVGASGRPQEGLREEHRILMQRFGPSPYQGNASNMDHLRKSNPNTDTIGFFLCKLRKKFTPKRLDQRKN